MSSKRANRNNQKVDASDTQVNDTPQVDEEVQEPEVDVDTRSVEERFRDENAFAAEWTDADIRLWERKVGDPSKAFVQGTDVLAFDPLREKRNANQWSTEELVEFLKGTLIEVNGHRRDEIINEYRRRVTVDQAWSDQDLMHYVRSGETPKKTASGVWLRDETREKRNPTSWTDLELRAWAAGEIHTKVSSQKLINEINLRFDLTIPNNTTDMQRVKKMVDEDVKRVETNEEAKKKGNLTEMNISHIDTVLEQYVTAVKPGQEITTQTATRAQNSLEGLFNYVVKLDGRAMADGLDKIRDKVAKHRKDVFHPDNAHRFTHYVKGDSSTKQRHMGLLELFIVVTDPVKARRKHTDYKAMLRNFPNDKMEKLVDYFKNYA